MADQLGHSTPMLTLRTYAHSMREEEADLGFADFATAPERTVTSTPAPGQKEAANVAFRRYPSPGFEAENADENAPSLSDRERSEILEHETGIEPATSTLATWCSTN